MAKRKLFTREDTPNTEVVFSTSTPNHKRLRYGQDEFKRQVSRKDVSQVKEDNGQFKLQAGSSAKLSTFSKSFVSQNKAKGSSFGQPNGQDNKRKFGYSFGGQNQKYTSKTQDDRTRASQLPQPSPATDAQKNSKFSSHNVFQQKLVDVSRDTTVKAAPDELPSSVLDELDEANNVSLLGVGLPGESEGGDAFSDDELDENLPPLEQILPDKVAEQKQPVSKFRMFATSQPSQPPRKAKTSSSKETTTVNVPTTPRSTRKDNNSVNPQEAAYTQDGPETTTKSPSVKELKQLYNSKSIMTTDKALAATRQNPTVTLLHKCADARKESAPLTMKELDKLPPKASVTSLKDFFASNVEEDSIIKPSSLPKAKVDVHAKMAPKQTSSKHASVSKPASKEFAVPRDPVRSTTDKSNYTSNIPKPKPSISQTQTASTTTTASRTTQPSVDDRPFVPIRVPSILPAKLHARSQSLSSDSSERPLLRNDSKLATDTRIPKAPDETGNAPPPKSRPSWNIGHWQRLEHHFEACHGDIESAVWAFWQEIGGVDGGFPRNDIRLRCLALQKTHRAQGGMSPRKVRKPYQIPRHRASSPSAGRSKIHVASTSERKEIPEARREEVPKGSNDSSLTGNSSLLRRLLGIITFAPSQNTRGDENDSFLEGSSRFSARSLLASILSSTPSKSRSPL
ncbi:hypothetical protein BZG36_01676 [Bifiguratus adelaidae]|uniref:Uncharacterized protein n=1 Tax=Bifiguratus adelaidae TaxID=1938954 RepID=A0A261Y4M3_9FUNG|nr:hypothetical protein BZG36_01676 [Bifiguratus adelaidae]